MTSAQLSAVFFLQVFFILAVCRCVGILARRFGQPQVVGEMIAGVIMGPSLFGLLFPSWQQVIFPKDSLKILSARLNGESNRTALAVGTLMNARGLMPKAFSSGFASQGSVNTIRLSFLTLRGKDRL